MLVEIEQAKADRMLTIDNIKMEIQMLQLIAKGSREAELAILYDEVLMAETLEISNNNFSSLRHLI